jgi:predicted TIM-barrel fold metal-dependent hydrolase
MATTDSSEKVTALEELEMVVDADSHFTETIGDLMPYVDETRHRAAKELMEASELKLSEVYSLTVASPGFAYASQSNTIEDNDESQASEGHVEKKLASMEEHGITHSVIGPTLNLIISSVNNTRFAVALANAYNSWVLDVMEGAPENLKATLLVAPQKPAEAAEEIDYRADEDRFVGVQLVASGLVPPPGHEWYNPIYQAAEDHDLPVVMHSGVGQTPKSFPIQYYWNETFAADHAVGHPFSHMWNLTSMLFEGVPQRYDLDFVFQEAGIGYVPYMMGRLDDHYLEMSYELPALEQLPSEYIQDQFHFTTQPLGLTPRNPKHIAWWVEMCGEETVVYSGDFPHPDFDPPEELFNRVCSHFDGPTTENLMGKTAAEVFDLK